MNGQQIPFPFLNDLNHLIYNLYEPSFAPHTRIVNFFRDLSPFIYFDRSSVLFYYLNGEGEYQKLTSVTLNWDAELLKKYDAYYSKMDDTLAPLDRAEPIVLRSSSLFNEELRKKSEYWTGYMLPNNADYEIMANLQIGRENPMRACISLTRGKGAGDFTQDDMQLLRVIQPHLSRVAAEHLKTLGNQREPAANDFYNCVAYCLLSENAQPVGKNQAFNELNRTTDSRLLGKITSLCLDMLYNPEFKDASHYECKLEDSSLFLEMTRCSEKYGEGKLFCCMVYDMSHFFEISLQHAKKKYELTDREYEILLSLLRGERQEAIAQRLYLSVPTIKKQVAAIYGKLEITSQKQILSRLHLL